MQIKVPAELPARIVIYALNTTEINYKCISPH